MIQPSRFLLALAIVAAGALGGNAFGAASSPVPVPATAPAPDDLSDPKRAATLLAALGSADYTQRQAAQKHLDAVPYSQVDIVRRLESQTSDPEIKARLQTRVDAMEVEAVLNPPPITLDLNNASLSDVAGALAKATGTTIRLADRMDDPTRFTLRVKNRSFWDAIDDLRQQNPIWLTVPPDWPAASWHLSSSFLDGAVSQSPDHAAGIRLLMGVTHGDFGGAAESPILNLAIGTDPRIKAALSGKINSVKDDAGHAKTLQMLSDSHLQYAWKWDEQPEALKRIKSVSVTGTLTMTVALYEERVVVDHPETRLKESIPVGGKYGQIAAFALSSPGPDGKRTLKIAVGLGAPPTPDRLTVARIATDSPFVEDGVWFDVVDGAGKTLWTGNHSQMMELAYTSGTITTAIQEPLKVILRAPATKELTLPFEFKNLPLK